MIHLVLTVTPSLKEKSLTDQARDCREKILANLEATAKKKGCSFSAFNRGFGFGIAKVYCEIIYGGVIIEVYYGPIISAHVIFLGSLWLEKSDFYANLLVEFPEIVDWGVEKVDL